MARGVASAALRALSKMLNQLLPIIRRKRKPLVVADAPPVVVGNVEPVQVNAKTTDHGQQTAGPAEAGTANENDAPNDSIQTE